MDVNAKIEFYKIIAQILPVLILAASIQSVFFINKVTYEVNEKLQRNIHIWSYVVFAFLLIMAEYVSLRNVFTGMVESSDLFLVTVAMITSIVWITAEYILGLLGKPKKIYLICFLTLGVLGIIIFMYLIFFS